jgi:polynucleotide 5'-kinase involved in rRNA processing
MNIPSSRLRRISFLGRKKRRVERKGDNTDELVMDKKSVQLVADFVEIFDNSQNKEKIILFKNNLDFTLVGKGIHRMVYGRVDIFGYSISSDDDCNDYSFDICEGSPLFSCQNSGKLINTENEYEEVMKSLQKFISLKNNKEFLQNNLNTIKNFFFSICKDRISIVYFKELSEDFKIIKIDKYTDYSNSDSKHDFIDYNKYEECISTANDSENIFIENKNFLICGKKNSGKSTFLQFLINKILGYLKDKRGHFTNEQNLFLIDCDSGQPLISSPYTVSLIKINKPLNFNFFNEKYRDNWYEIIASIFVEENTPTNKFEEYMKSVKALKEIYNKCGLNNYLVINTNGYTHGLGNVVNSSIVEIMKPDVNFYVKNLNSGRLEKGKEFEDFIIHEQTDQNLNIVMRQFSLQSSNSLSLNHHKTNLEIKTIVVENNFKLKELKNLEKKNENKALYLLENLVQSGKHSLFYPRKSKGLNSILDLIESKSLAEKYLLEVPFDKIFFSFNFSHFIPSSEIDIFLSINSKICFVLKQSTNTIQKSALKQSNLNLINFELVPINERLFECFAFIYNIDIINRKLIIFSEKLKNSFNKNPDRKIILYRNNTAIDKVLTQTTEKEKFLENKMKSLRFTNLISADDISTENQYRTLYSTRNKYSLI